jgi:hypothetical protein
MGQSCLPSQSYYRSCSKNTQKRSVSARQGRRHTRTYLRRHTIHATIIKEQSPLIPVTTFLRLLGLLMYLTKSRPDIIMTAVSFGATKSTSPTQDDHKTRVAAYTSGPAGLYEVDASCLIHFDSKGYTGYTSRGLHPNNGTFFYNRSAKQTLVSTSSTHAEMRAL